MFTSLGLPIFLCCITVVSGVPGLEATPYQRDPNHTIGSNSSRGSFVGWDPRPQQQNRPRFGGSSTSCTQETEPDNGDLPSIPSPNAADAAAVEGMTFPLV